MVTYKSIYFTLVVILKPTILLLYPIYCVFIAMFHIFICIPSLFSLAIVDFTISFNFVLAYLTDF